MDGQMKDIPKTPLSFRDGELISCDSTTFSDKLSNLCQHVRKCQFIYSLMPIIQRVLVISGPGRHVHTFSLPFLNTHLNINMKNKSRQYHTKMM